MLAQQPPELRDFLLKTSVADVLSASSRTRSPGGATASSRWRGSSASTRSLSALGPDRTWFRYHPLFAELLRSQLRFELPDLVPRLCTAAQRSGTPRARAPAQALRHAAAAADWDLVGALAGEHWVPLLIRGELGALGAALARLPRGPATRDPEVALAFAGVLLDAGDEAGSALLRPRRRRRASGCRSRAASASTSPRRSSG